jgi:hypothetical protein
MAWVHLVCMFPASTDFEVLLSEGADNWSRSKRSHPMSNQLKPAQTKKSAKQTTKTETLRQLIKRSKGATLVELQKATGWQAHSVRGAISGTLRKKLGLAVIFKETEKRGRFYIIAQSVDSGANQ